MVAIKAHNLEVGGSNPPPATMERVAQVVRAFGVGGASPLLSNQERKSQSKLRPSYEPFVRG